jgi:hypothetical protein
MISVIIPSVRDYRWQSILDNLSSTKTDFEVIACGPCPPQNLGPNFRAIQTPVKGAQCIEIGVRHSQGEYLYITCDDVAFPLNNLDTFLEYRLSCKEKLIILSPVFKQLGKDFDVEEFLFPAAHPNGVWPNDDKNAPVVPSDVFISKEDWNTIGGIDKNFISAYWGLDIAMRCWAMGGRTIILRDLYTDEIIPNMPNIGAENGRASYHQDLPYLLSLWTDGSKGATPGRLRKTRSKPVEPFSDYNILVADQGVIDVRKKKCQHIDALLLEYIKTGKSPGCRDLV